MTPGSEQGPGRIPEELPVFGSARHPRPKQEMDMPRRYSRWALWGCFALVLTGLLVGGGFLLVALQRPGFKSWVRFGEEIAVCRENLVEISAALERYQTDKGALPMRLEALYPTYLARSEVLICPAAPPIPPGETKAGRRTSYVLNTSGAWGKGKGIVVACPYHQVPAASDTPADRRLWNVLVIRQNGSVDGITGKLDEIAPWAADAARER